MGHGAGPGKIPIFLVAGIFAFSLMAASVHAASSIEFDPNPPGTVCEDEKTDITVKGSVPLTMTQQAACLISPPYHISFDLYLMEDDAIGDDQIAEHWSGGYSYDCVDADYTWTFKDIVPSNWAGGSEGSQIEIYAKVVPEDVSGAKTGNRNVDTLYNCDCLSGPCCTSSRPYKYKSSGSQPTGYTDYYYCSGTPSPTGTDAVYRRDYFCSGADASEHHNDIRERECGTCAYCRDGHSSCFFYYQNEKCGTLDCDYLESSYPCRDYHDADKKCTGGGACEATASCSNSYTNRPKHTSCGSEKECNGEGSCITCTSHAYTMCHDNDVYFYDACDNREDKEDECGGDSCSWYGLPKCEGNNVVQKKECHDRGCSNSACYDNIWYPDYQLKYECQNGCENGKCINECNSDSDCGAGGWVYFCGDGSWGIADGNAYRIYEARRCKYPGSAAGASYCYSDYGSPVLAEVCNHGCSNGKCSPPPCTDECPPGQTRCSGDIKQDCGNYDADSCSEWPSSAPGPGNEECACGCQGGECIVLEGDANSDGAVNIFDLAAVGLCYGQNAAGGCQSADVTGDGMVNIFDLASVGLNYGRTC